MSRECTSALVVCIYLLPWCTHADVVVPLNTGGFITTWDVHYRQGKSDKLISAAQSGERFDLRAALGKRFRRRKYRLSAVIHVPRIADVQFKLGCTRRCTLSVDGDELARLDASHGAHVDDNVTSYRLTPGEHSVEVLVTPKARGHRAQDVILRLHDSHNQPIEGVVQRIPLSRDPAKLLADRMAVEFTSQVVNESMVVTARIIGALSPSIPLTVELSKASGATVGASLQDETSVQYNVPARSERTQLTLRFLSEDRVVRTVTHHVRSDSCALKAIQMADDVLELRISGKLPEESWDTLEYSTAHLLSLLHDADSDTKWIRTRSAAVMRLASALKVSDDPLAKESGVVLRAYRSALDGRLQPYALYIPPSYTGAIAYPLISALHPSGYHPLLALRLAMGSTGHGSKRARTRHHPSYRDRRTFVVAPYGYRGTGSRYFGKVDVLEVIRRVSKRYRIAPDRVTLTGGSLGGLGSFHLGLRMPDRFNAIMPIAGYGSVRLYGDVMRKSLLPWEKFLVERRDNTSFAVNGRNLFMHCVHGQRDSPRRSEVIVNRYRRYGYKHRYELVEDVGHNAWDDGYDGGAVFRLNRRHRVPSRPRRVTFVSGSYRHRSAYWVRVEQYIDHSRLGQVSGVLRVGYARIQTENVRRLSLELKGESPVIDGQRFAPATGWSTYVRDESGWSPTAQMTPPRGEKRPGISGPMDDILYEPHVFVYGTQDPTQTETNERRAREASRYFWNGADIHVPVVADDHLTEAQSTTLHLVLFGNPRSNSVLAKMEDRLPIRFDSGSVVFGGRRFSGPSVGASFIYPNPLTDGRTYVKVHAGVTQRGTWLSGYLPRWGPDYLIYDEGISVQRFGRLMDKRLPLAGGFFDRNWN